MAFFEFGLTRRQERKLDRILEEIEEIEASLVKLAAAVDALVRPGQAVSGKATFPKPVTKE